MPKSGCSRTPQQDDFPLSNDMVEKQTGKKVLLPPCSAACAMPREAPGQGCDAGFSCLLSRFGAISCGFGCEMTLLQSGGGEDVALGCTPAVLSCGGGHGPRVFCEMGVWCRGCTMLWPAQLSSLFPTALISELWFSANCELGHLPWG